MSTQPFLVTDTRTSASTRQLAAKHIAALRDSYQQDIDRINNTIRAGAEPTQIEALVSIRRTHLEVTRLLARAVDDLAKEPTA